MTVQVVRSAAGLACLLLLAGCGVRTNPEKGPVVLLCQGEEVSSVGDGKDGRAQKRVFYRIDGKKRSLEQWNDTTQSFAKTHSLTISPTEIKIDDGHTPGDEWAFTAITFDRVSGSVSDELHMSNGGQVIFSGSCKPVKSPTSETKF